MGQNYRFFFYSKIIRILRSCSMKIFSKFPTVNISKHNFWLLIYIAKNFIWTTLKVIFSIFRFFASSDSRFTNIVQTIHQWKDDLFRLQMMYKSDDWSHVCSDTALCAFTTCFLRSESPSNGVRCRWTRSPSRRSSPCCRSGPEPGSSSTRLRPAPPSDCHVTPSASCGPTLGRA